VSFARANYAEQVAKWKWVLLAALVLPLSMVTFFKQAFFGGPPILVDASALVIRMGWSGYIWHVLWLIFSVLILMNLERTFRHIKGRMRWQSKFIFLALGCIFGMRLFTDSQAILFKNVNTDRAIITVGALVIAVVLMLRALFRGKPLNISIHLSHQFLYNSLTVLKVGIYLVSAAVIAWLSLQFGWIRNIHVAISLVFLVMIGSTAILFSDRIRIMRKRLISRHFKRPQYDYRKIWEGFTMLTTSVTEIKDLCSVIVKMLSETLEILSVSIWLVDEKQERLSFGGSTAVPDTQVAILTAFRSDGADLIRAMIGQTSPVDLKGHGGDSENDFKQACEIDTDGSRIRYCVPLNVAGHLIGLMTLGEKVFHDPLTFEESELIKTVADQAAAGLLNLRLAERLRQAKEQEAFQSMSAFFMHDLKNLASRLSLVTQNLPIYMDDPEFRADALRTISQSVSKIDNIGQRLCLLSQKLDLTFKETNVNELIVSTVSDVKKYIRVPITQQLGILPLLSIDREQVHKVVENLLMNAHEALVKDGLITIATRHVEKQVEISVRDNGCGMSNEFMEKRLFRPFQTTKKKGMGIGLYHSKAIVEAHSGRIEVESEQEKGTTFRVLLPCSV
jgi:putative PEP-CTERM system histidine kinase